MPTPPVVPDPTTSEFDFTRWMTPEALAAYSVAVRRRTFAAGANLYLEGEPGAEMYRIVRGSVRLSVMGPEGRQATFLLFGAGAAFGVSSLIDGGPRPQTAQALTEVDVEILDSAAFGRLRMASRAFDDALLRLIAQQMRVVSGFYAQAQLADLRERVVRRIRETMRTFGAADDEGTRLSLRLSQSDLAALVGSSRQSVGKILQALQAEGLIRIEYGNILVLSPEKLASDRR